MKKRIALILCMIMLAIGFGQVVLGEQIDISISDGISIEGTLPEWVDTLQSPILVPVEDNYQYILSSLSAFNEQEEASVMVIPCENRESTLVYNCAPQRSEPASQETVTEYLTTVLSEYGICGLSVLSCNSDEESTNVVLIPQYSALATVSQSPSIQCTFSDKGIVYFSGSIYRFQERRDVLSLLSSAEMLDRARNYLAPYAEQGRSGVFCSITLGDYYIASVDGSLEGRPVWYFERIQQTVQSFEEGMNLIGNFAIDCETGKVYN